LETRPYNSLQRFCNELGFSSEWVENVCALGNQKLSDCNHGDFGSWKSAIDSLPGAKPFADLDLAAPQLGEEAQPKNELEKLLMALHPWRKGPLNIAGIDIDTEWRSDWKWSRVSPHVDLSGKKILDIGCGNGYYGWRMLAEGADLVTGVDPTWVFVMQWLACRHFAGNLPNFVLPLAIEDLPDSPVSFDCVFSMGVLYHRREPLHHLGRLRNLLGPGGTMVLETLVLPDDRSSEVLVPPERYARMRNVWAVPGCGRLAEWVRSAGFCDVEIVDLAMTTTEEQRSTHWMKFESLAQSLDPDRPSLTIEGHPAPRRAVVVARRK